MAHVPVWSNKLGRLTKQTHVGVGWFFAIPLCRSCHVEQHMHGGNKWLWREIGKDRVYGWIANSVSDLLGVKVETPKEIRDALEERCSTIES